MSEATSLSPELSHGVSALARSHVAVEATSLVNTRNPDGRGDFAYVAVEAVDPSPSKPDPLTYT